jgi:hypothetical protein
MTCMYLAFSVLEVVCWGIVFVITVTILIPPAVLLAEELVELFFIPTIYVTAEDLPRFGGMRK